MNTPEAEPLSVVFTAGGYILRIRVNQGPKSMLDRVIRVRLTAAQLDQISEWEPGETSNVLDLTNVEKVS